MTNTTQLASKGLVLQSIDRTRRRISAIRSKRDGVELYGGRFTHLQEEGYVLEVLVEVKNTLEGGEPWPAL